MVDRETKFLQKKIQKDVNLQHATFYNIIYNASKIINRRLKTKKRMTLAMLK